MYHRGHITTKVAKDYWRFKFDLEAIIAELYRVTKPRGVVVWVVGDTVKNKSETGEPFRQALAFQAAGWKIWDTMIYQKSAFNKPSTGRYHQAFEFMFVFSKGRSPKHRPIKDRPNKTAGKKRKIHFLRRNPDGSFEPAWKGPAGIVAPHGLRTCDKVLSVGRHCHRN
jgi:DNA modification methylase